LRAGFLAQLARHSDRLSFTNGFGTIELRGHIIVPLFCRDSGSNSDSWCEFQIGEIKIGERRARPELRPELKCPRNKRSADELMLRLRQHGAEVIERANVQLASAPADGVFPTIST